MVAVDGQNVSLYPMEGGDPRPVPGLLEGEKPVRWSADGRSLYVRRMGETPVKMYSVDTSTGQRQPWSVVAPAAPPRVQFLVAADGKSYVYASPTSSSDLYLVEGLK